MLTLTTHGFELPPAVQRRLRGKLGTSHDELCFLAASPCDMLLPQHLLKRFYKPALDFSRTTKLWRPQDLPDKINAGSITYYRHGFVMNLANVMLRHGYLIVVQPYEGCETFAIGLTGFRTAANPRWLGSGFTKT